MIRPAAGLLAAAVAASAYAWQVQHGAAAMLARAHALQEAGGSGGIGGTGPELADYRAVLATLQRSVAIRRAIDALVRRAEAIVASLERARRASLDTAAAGRTELAALAAELGAAASAARAGGTALGPLEARLERAARLAGAIAAELAELDRSLGPALPAGGRR